MPSPEQACLVQDAVYWPPSSFTRRGDVNWGTPVAIKVRLESDKRITPKSDGGPVSNVSTLFVDRDLEEDGKIWIGSICDLPTTPTGVIIITGFNKIGDIKGIHFTRTVTGQRQK